MHQQHAAPAWEPLDLTSVEHEEVNASFTELIEEITSQLDHRTHTGHTPYEYGSIRGSFSSYEVELDTDKVAVRLPAGLVIPARLSGEYDATDEDNGGHAISWQADLISVEQQRPTVGKPYLVGTYHITER